LRASRESGAVFVDLVFVGVDDVNTGLTVDGERVLEERVEREDVVVIEQGDVLARSQRESAVAGCRNVSVLLAKDDLDARIVAGVFFEHGAYVWLFRCIVRDA